jgi:hypothetical protein
MEHRLLKAGEVTRDGDGHWGASNDFGEVSWEPAVPGTIVDERAGPYRRMLACTDLNVVTLAKGGIKERQVKLEDVKVPDLWHIANHLEARGFSKPCADAVLECWHLCHDLLKELRSRI